MGKSIVKHRGSLLRGKEDHHRSNNEEHVNASTTTVAVAAAAAGDDDDGGIGKKKTRKEKELREIDASKYERGTGNIVKGIKDKKLKSKLKKNEVLCRSAAERAARAEILLQEEAGQLEAEGMERTYKYRQADLANEVDANTSAKMLDIQLDNFGPYRIDYTRNGRHLLIGGSRGHIATFDWQAGVLGAEIQVSETVRDIAWLHNESMFAVAQKKYVYIYDHSGAEVHCLRSHIEPSRLEFLPYHFLLVSVGSAGYLKYQDVSTGRLVTEWRTALGPCSTMTQNPWNAVVHLGHNNGTVSLWTPNISTPVVKMLCHRAPVKSIAVDSGGNYMVSSGLDGQMKVWDVRTYKSLHSYYTPTPATSLSISQRGMLAVGFGPHVQIWSDPFRHGKQSAPYMNHLLAGRQVANVAFVPFEDFLGVGHSNGLASLVVPGSGEPNFDALEQNPYQSASQRRETEVRRLLEKVQPELISLDPNAVGMVDRAPKDIIEEERKKRTEKEDDSWTPRHRMKGRSSSMRRYLRKGAHIIDENRQKLRAKLEKENELIRIQRDSERGIVAPPPAPREALDRFAAVKK